MKSASSSLPDQPVNGLTAGVDWACEDHAVAVVDDCGREIARRTVVHSAEGLRDLLGLLGRYGVQEVAIERPDGPVVEALLEAGTTVVVISPNQVKNLRGRYGSAGHKDDRFDAFVLADTLRTDRARLVPLTPDSDATVALRRMCRARKDLVGHRVAATNQRSDGERLQHLRSLLPCRVRVTAAVHPLFGELLACSGFKRWNGVLLLVVELPDGSPGTVHADATDIFPTAPLTPTGLVLDGEGIQALHGLVVALQRRPSSGWKGK